MNRMQWITAGLLLAALPGCGGSTDKSSSRPAKPRTTETTGTMAMPDENYPKYDYFERRMQILEHRINSMNPENSELRELITRLKTLETDNRTLRDDLARIQNQLTMNGSSQSDLRGKLADLDARLTAQDQALAEIRDMATVGHVRPPANNGTEKPPVNVNTPATNMEDRRERMSYVSKQVGMLVRGEAEFDLVLRNVRQYEHEAAPVLITLLKESADTNEKAHCQRLLVGIGTDEVVDLLLNDLTDDLSQIVASDIVETLGMLSNPRAENVLLDHLRKTDNQYFKLDVANALAHMDNVRGVSTLIEFLKSDNASHRILAINHLRELFGTDRGYSAYDPESKRQDAVEAWLAWYEKTFDE